MPFIPVPNCAELTVNYEWFGQRVQNTLWFRHQVAIDLGALQQLVDSMETHVTNEWLPIQSEDLTYRSIEAVAQDTAIDFFATATLNAGSVGGLATPSVSNSVSLSVSFRTGLTGRSNRGRNYWLGIPATSVVDNVVSPVYQESIIAAYDGVIGPGAIASDWEWVIASRYFQGQPRLIGQSREVVAATIVDSIIDNQRRRLPGRGV